MKRGKILRKRINSVDDFLMLYKIGHNGFPLPFVFKINDKTYNIIYIYGKDEVETENEQIEIVDENGEYVSFEELIGEEFEWEFKNVSDYFKNYFVTEGSVYINLNNIAALSIEKNESNIRTYDIYVNGNKVGSVNINEDIFGKINLWNFNNWLTKYIINIAKKSNGIVIL